MIGIYKYTNKLNGKIYIGRSVNITRRRWEHLNSPSPYSYFDQTLNKLGEQAFDFEIVEECNANELKDRERYWIKFYNCCVLDDRSNGYNLTRGGEEYKSSENPWAKLKESQVNEIIQKLAKTTETIEEIASEYNVHRNTISSINRCHAWQWLHNYQNNIRVESQGSLHRGELSKKLVITEEIALNIINDIKNSNLSLAAIGRKYNLKDSLIYDINRCKTWKHLHNYKNNIRNEYRKESDAK